MDALTYCKENSIDYLAKQWNRERNNEKCLSNYTYSSHKKVWWRCDNGHEWQSTLRDHILLREGCPYCSGKKAWPGGNDLLTLYPATASEWHPRNNRGLLPRDVTPGSARKVWWQCRKGHEWTASVENRAIHGQNCPYCSGKKAWSGENDLQTLYPKIAAQWHPTRNSDLTPKQVRPGSGKRVWWICEEGHVWQTPVFSRTSKKRPGCPVCAGNARKKQTFIF